jgi:hypothetical protein
MCGSQIVIDKMDIQEYLLILFSVPFSYHFILLWDTF